MIARCRRRFPGVDFRVTGASGLETGSMYDYVIASGTFNVKQDAAESEWKAYFEKQLALMYGLCTRAMIVNMMTEFVEHHYPRLYYPAVGEIAAFAAHRLGARFILDRSYPLFEMTAVLLKDGPRGSGD